MTIKDVFKDGGDINAHAVAVGKILKLEHAHNSLSEFTGELDEDVNSLHNTCLKHERMLKDFAKNLVAQTEGTAVLTSKLAKVAKVRKHICKMYVSLGVLAVSNIATVVYLLSHL